MRRFLRLAAALLCLLPGLALAQDALPPSTPAGNQKAQIPGYSFQRQIADALNNSEILYVNFKPTNTSKFQKSKTDVLSGLASSRYAFVGDSTTKGAGATAITGMVSQICDYLNANGIPATDDNIFGVTFGGTDLKSFDSRISFNGGWTNFGGNSVGGNFFTTSSSGTLSFAPRKAVDTFEIYDIRFPGAGTFTVNINGGASLGTINQNGTSALAKETFTAALGNNVVNIVQASGSDYIIGINAYNSAVKSIQLLNLGWSGSTAENWDVNTNAWNPKSALQYLTPSVTFIGLGINNWRVGGGGTTVAAYKMAMTNIITAALASGDVILFTEVPGDLSDASVAQQVAYVQAMYDLSAQFDIPLIDTWSRWQSFALRNPLGWMTDVRHPTRAGYNDLARFIGRKILGM